MPDLGQYPGKLHPLPLAAGEARIEPFGQMFDPRMGHGGGHYLLLAASGFAVGQASHGHHLFTEKGEVERRALRQHPEPVGQLAAIPQLTLPAKQGDGAFMGQLTGQAFEQGALARPVGAEQGGQGAAVQSEIEPIQDLALATAQAQSGAGQQGGGKSFHSNPY